MTTPTVRRPAVLFSAVFLSMTGCSSNDCTLTGTVSFRGKPVIFGTVIVQASDGMRRIGRIDLDGSYTVEKLPAGPVKISVESPEPTNPAASPKRPPRSNGPAELPEDYKPPDRSKWARLPDKYSDPDQSGLTTTVRSGPNHFDIPLP